MKKICLIGLCLLSAYGLFAAASLEEMLSKAREHYSAGSYGESVETLGLAAAAHQGSIEAKKALGEAYAEIGVREYDIRNFRNAYECFRTALKLSPTNQVASQYFWKMRKELPPSGFRNEADEAARQQTERADARTGGAQAAGSRQDEEALEKLRKAELELRELKEAAEAARTESAQVKGELERQRKRSEDELETLKGSTDATKRESSQLKLELEQQKRRAELELAALKESTDSSRDENRRLREELEAQRKRVEEERETLGASAMESKAETKRLENELELQKRSIEQLRENIRSGGQGVRRDGTQLSETMNAFRDMIERESDAREREIGLLSERLGEQGRLLARQVAYSSRLVLVIGGIVLFAIASFFVLVLLARARARRRRTAVYGPGSFLAPGDVSPRVLPGGATPETFLLDFYSPAGKPEDQPIDPGETNAVYRDLIRAERLKRLYDQMKSGSLRWDTLRDYIHELDVELRVEILKVVETKLVDHDLFTPQAALSVLFPFLTERDDYLREKAESLAKAALAVHPGREGVPAEEPASSAYDGSDASPLAMNGLLKALKRLETALRGRDGSARTARIARGAAYVLGLSAEDIDLVYRAALAHDFGYLMMDSSRLRRVISKTRISEEEFDFIKTHAKKGIRYFAGKKLPQPFKDAVLYHHERNDGSGYPEGLAAGKIPLFAKIIGVAETYVALTSERPYRDKHSPQAALAIIRDGAETKFDRDHVNALAEFVKRTGELG